MFASGTQARREGTTPTLPPRPAGATRPRELVTIGNCHHIHQVALEQVGCGAPTTTLAHHGTSGLFLGSFEWLGIKVRRASHEELGLGRSTRIWFVVLLLLICCGLPALDIAFGILSYAHNFGREYSRYFKLGSQVRVTWFSSKKNCLFSSIFCLKRLICTCQVYSRSLDMNGVYDATFITFIFPPFPCLLFCDKFPLFFCS